MKKALKLQNVKKARQKRVRAKIFGTANCPRLAVSRSNRFIYGQLINDEKGVTLVAASSKELPRNDQDKKKSEQALMVGELIAKKAALSGIVKAVFDRRAYQYHGRVKAVAEGARNGGLSL